MDQKRAIVVGAGIAGLASAHALLNKGFNVTVIERNGRAVGASIRNFGMLWPIGQPAEYFDIAMRSIEIWKNIAQETGFKVLNPGSLHVAYHDDEWEVLEQVYREYKTTRCLQLLDPQVVEKYSPAAVKRNLKGTLFSSTECIVDPVEAIASAAAYLAARNVQFRWETAVVQVNSNKVALASGEQLDTDVTVICSGAEFDLLFPAAFCEVAMTRCKLQMMRFVSQGDWSIGPALCAGLSLIHYKSFTVAETLKQLRDRYKRELPQYVEKGIHVMVSQNARGELVVGDSHEYGSTHSPFDSQQTNDLILDYLWQFADFKNSKLLHTWNGTYSKMTDGSNYFFKEVLPDVYLFNGLGGNGMTLGFGLAEKLITKT